MLNVCESVTDYLGQSQCLIVAFASMGGDNVDQHFGSAEKFFVYAVTATAADLVCSRTFGFEKKDGNEDKLKPKLQWLVGSDIVYCGSVGDSATRQLINLGVSPIKVKSDPRIAELIGDIQRQMNGDPEFWLENILRKKMKLSNMESRFDFVEEDSWD